MNKAFALFLAPVVLVGMSFAAPAINGSNFTTAQLGTQVTQGVNAVGSAITGAGIYTSGTGITGADKLGAHQNGGRGCAGCHAPHSGGLGGGGNALGTGTVDNESGTVALFGQDVSPLYGAVLTFGKGYQETLPASSAVASQDLTGVAFCLACHDGNIAKGGMMTGSSYEAAQGMLPAGVYGPRANMIPTLLGNDNGLSSAGYTNDHPVGPGANLGALGQASHFTVVAGAITGVVATDAKYLGFVTMYGGAPSLFGGRGGLVITDTAAVTAQNAYVVCTSCHTPHTMYTASAKPNGATTAGTYPTYFFLVGPYNPGSKPAYNQASSATQFCRQCHFTGAGGSNEGSGIMNIQTAF